MNLSTLLQQFNRLSQAARLGLASLSLLIYFAISLLLIQGQGTFFIGLAGLSIITSGLLLGRRVSLLFGLLTFVATAVLDLFADTIFFNLPIRF